MSAIYLVDDDADVRDALGWMLEAKGLHSEAFDSGNRFLEQLDPQTPGVAVLDINMPGMDGLAVQQALLERGSRLSLIFLTGYATVPKAVQAVQAGALDFLEKPVDGDRLIALIEEGLVRSEQRHRAAGEAQALTQKLASLTERERQLMALVVAGKTNKAIGAELFIAQRTVEIHRKNLFDKMGVHNAAELALLIGRHQGGEAEGKG
ncbi:response regulator transcription factor [Ferrimonas balearica]|uniref:response regulator transcription factor n=1 Tax=Ferrimonas balearica TaxID=44012 RepID=UPI001C9996AF|nr:response regulator [Ferrimonas balearica]MBY5992677.1 response regulator [Ferrimonas balearica]